MKETDNGQAVADVVCVGVVFTQLELNANVKRRRTRSSHCNMSQSLRHKSRGIDSEETTAHRNGDNAT